MPVISRELLAGGGHIPDDLPDVPSEHGRQDDVVERPTDIGCAADRQCAVRNEDVNVLEICVVSG